MSPRPLPFNADLREWLRLGLVKEVGCTASGVMSYSLTPTGRALLTNRLACEAEDNFPTSNA